MLTPEYLEQCADGIIELYAQLDEDIARDIVRRIIKTGEITDTAKWQMLKLQEGGVIYDDAIKTIAKYSGKGEKELTALFEKSGVVALEFDDAIYKSVGFSASPLKKSANVLQVLTAGLQKTNGSINNLVMSTAVQAQNAYFVACDRAYMQVMSGAFDYITAIRTAVRDASSAGTTVLYPSGHVDKLDVAIRRSVITGVSQTSLKISESRADEFECDLVETTAHMGARPSHAEWQGRVFSRSGKNKRYPPFSLTGYGSGDGLGGWNCRHAFYPFFEGFSVRAYTEERIKKMNEKVVKYNDEEMSVYTATQKQRAMERQMRKERRELAGLDEAIKSSGNQELQMRLKEDFATASVKLKKHEDAYKDFSHQVRLPTQNERLQVGGYGKSVSQKVVHTNKKRNDSLKYIQQDVKLSQDNSLPKRINLPDEKIKQTVNINIGNMHSVVPKGADATNVYIMAGSGSSVPIRDLRRLVEQYPNLNAADWTKKSGDVNTDNYKYVVHWYENNGYVPSKEIKVKGVKRK